MISVTKLLATMLDLDTQWFTETHASRGHVTHEVIHRHNTGEDIQWVLEKLDPDLIGYVQSYLLWYRTAKPEILFSEAEVRDEELGLVGHPDFVARIQGATWLFDVKTGGPQEHFKLQTELYRLLIRNCKNIFVTHRACIYLKKDGSFPTIDEHKGSIHEAHAMYLIQAYHVRKTYGNKKAIDK